MLIIISGIYILHCAILDTAHREYDKLLVYCVKQGIKIESRSGSISVFYRAVSLQGLSCTAAGVAAYAPTRMFEEYFYISVYISTYKHGVLLMRSVSGQPEYWLTVRQGLLSLHKLPALAASNVPYKTQYRGVV